MNKSQSINELATALCNLHNDVVNVHKNAKGRFNYASLDNILKLLRPLLHKQGLSMSQHPAINEHGVCVTTLVTHNSGQWMQSDFSIPYKDAVRGTNPAQEVGAAVSYARRYAIVSIFAMAQTDQEDDDAESLSIPAPAKPKAPNIRALTDTAIGMIEAGKIPEAKSFMNDSGHKKEIWAELSQGYREEVTNYNDK